MIATLIFWLLGLGRLQKRLLQAVFDLACAAGSFLFVSAVFSGFVSQSVQNSLAWASIFSAIVVAVAHLLGLYRAVVRYAGVRALRSVLLSSLAAGLATWGLAAAFGQTLSLVVMAVTSATTAGLMSVGRLFLREVFYLVRKTDKPNVVLYGAGDAGRQLLTSFAQSSSHRVVAMVDDSPALHGTEVHGVRIYPPTELAHLQQRYQVQAVILAAPSISRQRKSEILQQLENLGLPLKAVPSVGDILTGRKSVADLQQIAIEEVLGRDPVSPNPELMRRKVAGRSVMVTGGGGSIGTELCLQIAALSPTRLVIVESSEFALYHVVTALQDRKLSSELKVIPVLQSVLNDEALIDCMQEHNVETVFHAAAFKHVPLVELNPFAGLQNNVFGTLSALNAAQAAGVRDFVLISTDKAVRPSNIMGASKRLAELVAQAYAMRQQGMCVAMVRFGNVLSSSGSVIPRFKEQIQAGGPVTVTHPEITRFFMTIPEAVELVLQASALAQGGEVFLLEMGESVRIVDLAKRMIRLSGYRPVIREELGSTTSATDDFQHDIAITYTGLRPGEKLYEELLISGDAQATDHPKIFKAEEHAVAWEELEPALDQLRSAIESKNIQQVRKVLEQLQVDYSEQVSDAKSVIAVGDGLSSKSAEISQSYQPSPLVRDPEASGWSSKRVETVSVKAADEKRINPFLSKILHSYFLIRRPMTLGARAVVINEKDEVMLVRHRYEPGWQLPGGGVESGESPVEALRRELIEEAGIRILDVTGFLGSYFNSEVSRRDHVLVYLVRDFEVMPGAQISHEIGENGFFPFDQLPKETTAGTRRRIAEIFEGQAVADVW
jgi:FlaA1/EpsC-like NDP-sugar epimerase/8-oxo-dGTP pyrophosphatase MutT (NUDIX family)